MTSNEYIELPIYFEQLAAALRFTRDDIEANRRGRLTGSQRTSQLRAVTVSVALSTICLLISLGLVGLALAAGLTTFSGLRILLIAVAFLAFGILGASFIVPLLRDLSLGSVGSLEGFVQPAVRGKLIPEVLGPGTPISSYVWVVDNEQRFRVSGRAYGVLTPARHRVYFLPRTRRVVAAEPAASKAPI